MRVKLKVFGYFRQERGPYLYRRSEAISGLGLIMPFMIITNTRAKLHKHLLSSQEGFLFDHYILFTITFIVL
jgi:hypothetical protein